MSKDTYGCGHSIETHGVDRSFTVPCPDCYNNPRPTTERSTRGMNEYDVVGLSPDSDAGIQALHEYLQDGYHVACQWRESFFNTHQLGEKPSVMWINHMMLRKPRSGL